MVSEDGLDYSVHSIKLKHIRSPPYLAKLLPKGNHLYNTHNSEDITAFQSRAETFKFSFFPWSIVEWNKPDLKIRNSSYLIFTDYLIKRTRPLAV